MRRLPLRIWLLLGFLATNGCECGGGDGCDVTELSIVRTAPPNGATTGRQQKFAVVVAYSDTAQAAFAKASVSVDEGPWIACVRGTPATQNIDGDGLHDDEYYFACPVTAVTLAPGKHTIVYSADAPGIALPKRSAVEFYHDTIPPGITPYLSATNGGNVISWSLTDDDDFDRVGLFVGGVEVTRSYEKDGQIILDESVRGRGSQVEVRAYDKSGNDEGHVVELR